MLIRRMIREKVMQVQAYRRYCHRLSVDGEHLHYVAMIAAKQRDIPAGLLDKTFPDSTAGKTETNTY